MDRSDDGRQSPAVPGERRTEWVLFWLYVLLYGGFMGLVLVRPDLLSKRPFGGVNLAIAYGMGLIAAAFVLALLSMVLRSARRRGARGEAGDR